MFECEIRKGLKKIIDEGRTNIAIYPYGTIGLQVEDILLRVFGITPKYVIDNSICAYNPKVCSLEEFKHADELDDITVIIATELTQIRDELKKVCLEFLREEQIATLLADDPRNMQRLSNGNRILGEIPKLRNSTLLFQGNNNILYCEPSVVLQDSSLCFCADNSIIYLGTNQYEYKINASIYNDSVLHIGKHNYFNQRMSIILSEQRHCFIGNYGVFSWGIKIRNDDPHVIYDCNTFSRINPTRSVYIGDHVWIGQNCTILKGTQIDSGSIIGGGAVAAGKRIPHNTTWAGNPLVQIKNNIFWENTCVHSWKEDTTKISENYGDFISKYRKNQKLNEWVYDYEETESLSYDEIDNDINKLKNTEDRLNYLLHLNNNNSKNRFVHMLM